jgi:hypothetical protein
VLGVHAVGVDLGLSGHFDCSWLKIKNARDHGRSGRFLKFRYGRVNSSREC